MVTFIYRAQNVGHDTSYVNMSRICGALLLIFCLYKRLFLRKDFTVECALK